MARVTTSTMVNLEAVMFIADPRQVPHGIFAYTLHPTRLAMLTEGATPEERTLAGQLLMGAWPSEAVVTTEPAPA